MPLSSASWRWTQAGKREKKLPPEPELCFLGAEQLHLRKQIAWPLAAQQWHGEELPDPLPLALSMDTDQFGLQLVKGVGWRG